MKLSTCLIGMSSKGGI